MKFTTEDRALHDAAQRAGIRTFAQSAGGSIAPLAATSFVLSGGNLVSLGIAVGGAIVTGAIAGLAAYLGMVGNGLPQAYAELALEDATRPRHAAE